MALATLTTGASLPQLEKRKSLSAAALRAAAVLTTSYVAGDHIDVGARGSVGFHVAYDASIDYTSIECIPQVSVDGSTWFDAADAISKTIANLFGGASSAGGFAVVTEVKAGARYARLAIKRTGGTAVGTVTVTGYAGA